MPNPSQPAFPGIEGSGMTLRQWYAGQALAGPCSHISDPIAAAKYAFAYADAMIAEGGE